ncbi:hypothetical protein CcCBS67573_g10661 [Chytriomyces confervae]|uniref:Uncharacterized protein n=1 Tax=Chytriomyces confervae TaxID=246404 RepID=A0A507CJ67_9FUNG|nr:hypothetical protein CcCBS67573_g10661 [Chytriomyces confervae]
MSNIANTEISTNATFTSTTNSTVAAANNSGTGGGSGLSMVQYAFLSIIVEKNLSNNLILQARPAMVHFQRMSNSANPSVSSNSTFTNATNSTLATADGSGSGGGGGSGLSIPQYAFLSIIVGLVIEISFTGIITITLRLFKKGGSKNFWKVASLMLFFNVWCIVYMVFFTLSFFAVKENCIVINTMSNISSQLFYVTYDLFMLYKTYAVSRSNRVVLYCIFVIVAHRAVWTGWDIAKSTGVYDPETDVCAYYQYPLSGFGYNAADLICDAFCTVVAIGFNCQFLFTSFGKLGEMIVKDNVLRSVLILSVNSYLLYVNLNVSDLMTILVAYMLQNYMYTRALNAEMFWAEERKIASVISRSGANSTSKFNTSSSAVKSAAYWSKLTPTCAVIDWSSRTACSSYTDSNLDHAARSFSTRWCNIRTIPVNFYQFLKLEFLERCVTATAIVASTIRLNQTPAAEADRVSLCHSTRCCQSLLAS